MVIAVVVAAVLVIRQHHPPAQANALVSTLLPGEFRAVPDACRSVSAATLSQYLPGTSRKVTHSISTPTQNQCTFTVDVKPVFRVLEVTAQAYQPSGLASGNGSATNNATDNYGQLRLGLASPPRKTHQPKALISAVSGLGQAAFSALQVFHVTGGGKTDRVTVIVRDHNALISVQLQGLDSTRGAGGGFGPVSVSQLQAGALAAARQVVAAVVAGPTVG